MLFVIIIAFGIIITLAIHMVRTFSGKPRRRPKSAPSDAENQLLHICRGDEDRYRRLLMHEITRAPEISSEEAASRAVYRLQRDNR